MTQATLPGKIVLAPWGGGVPLGAIGTALGSNVTFQFNAAGDKVAIIFTAQSTTVPDLVSFVVQAVTTAGSAGTIDATLETLTNGEPAGAVTNSATGSATISTTGQKTISGMAGTASITAGTQYAVVLTAGTGWNRDLTIRLSLGSSSNQSFPLIKTKDSAGAWTNSTGTNCGWCFGLADSGGNYIQQVGLLGSYDCALQAYSSATNPDERGNRFVLAAPLRCCGVMVLLTGGTTPGANDDVRYKLLSSHTSSPVERLGKTLEGEETGGSMPKIIMFGDSYLCEANVVYAVTAEALGSETQSVPRWDYPSNAHLAGILGTSFHATTRDGLGNCSDADTDSFYGIFPIFDQADDATGGSGGATGSGIVGLHGINTGVIA